MSVNFTMLPTVSKRSSDGKETVTQKRLESYSPFLQMTSTDCAGGCLGDGVLGTCQKGTWEGIGEREKSCKEEKEGQLHFFKLGAMNMIQTSGYPNLSNVQILILYYLHVPNIIRKYLNQDYENLQMVLDSLCDECRISCIDLISICIMEAPRGHS